MDFAEINAGVSGNSAANNAAAGLASNFDDFLTLLTTQLQNQDPLNPADSNEFTNQLVNFTNVEQNIATNKNLEALVQLQQITQQNSQAATLINYLGKSVGTSVNIADLSGGGASWNIDFGTSAATVTYDVYNSAGTKVYSEDANGAQAGPQTFDWNGETTSGGTAEDGYYYLVATAKTAGDSEVNVSYSFKGVANSVETVNGVPVLKVGNVPISLADISSIEVIESNEPSA